jgi:aminoglycoside phosphotransferase (APT) family kinase protein
MCPFGTKVPARPGTFVPNGHNCNVTTIDTALVYGLVAAQFPQWADLLVEPIVPGGWDNRTFRLGDRMTVRLPSAEGYVPQIEKEHRWLPELARQLPLPIPTPVALGRPGEGFPWPWSIYGWIDGETSTVINIRDLEKFANDLAGFLIALRNADATDGPLPGPHNFYRGGSPAFYDAEARQAIVELGASIDGAAATDVWEAAVESEWTLPPVWFHGDISSGNLLVRDGELSAVLDFGTSGIGDPACDLVIAFSTLAAQRDYFRALVDLDDDTWARARGWAIWKALIVAAGSAGSHDPEGEAVKARRVIDEVIADHQR